MARKTRDLGDPVMLPLARAGVVPVREPEYYFNMGSAGKALYNLKGDACWAARRRAYTSQEDVIVMRSVDDGPDIEVERFRAGVEK